MGGGGCAEVIDFDGTIWKESLSIQINIVLVELMAHNTHLTSG